MLANVLAADAPATLWQRLDEATRGRLTLTLAGFVLLIALAIILIALSAALHDIGRLKDCEKPAIGTVNNRRTAVRLRTMNECRDSLFIERHIAELRVTNRAVLGNRRQCSVSRPMQVRFAGGILPLLDLC
jgi:hypothetical protein